MSGNRHRRPPGRPVHLSLLVLAAAALARALSDRGGAVRVASLLLHRLGRTPSHSPRAPEESRLYARRRRRLEAHLGRLPDGRRVVVALPVDGSARAATYRVGESRPWHDFERQARLLGAPWGPCRSGNAGL